MTGILLDSPALDVFGQMALDEVLARSAPHEFILRFFRWAGPGVTFGYAQRIAEVERVLPAEAGSSYTRRLTGGGVVPHLDDLTFTCVFPAAGTLRPAAIYRRLHAAVADGLRKAGLAADLCATGASAPSGPQGASQCFVEPVAMDILLEGGKILGGAIRRMGETVLYQGSLQLPDARRRAAAYESAIRDALASAWGLKWRQGEADADVLKRAEELVAKYRSPEWIRRR